MLLDWSQGDQQALDRLIPVVYGELRRLASRHLRRERADHTLQTTALIHEAYLKLVEQRNVQWQNRAHFFGIAAQLMRRILVDHARTRHRVKRGGAATRVPLEEVLVAAEGLNINLVSLDEALTKLAGVDSRLCRTVELRFFGGMSVEETAEVLRVSAATVKNDWSMAKAWLRRELLRGERRDT
jgi:RNA polymerase sigma factor (TIGR02999 family)